MQQYTKTIAKADIVDTKDTGKVLQYNKVELIYLNGTSLAMVGCAAATIIKHNSLSPVKNYQLN